MTVQEQWAEAAIKAPETGGARCARLFFIRECRQTLPAVIVRWGIRVRLTHPHEYRLQRQRP